MNTPSIFEPLLIPVVAGQSVQELIDSLEIPTDLQERVYVAVNDIAVYDWKGVFLIPGDVVRFAIVPSGSDNGKQIISSLAIIAISLSAPYLAPMLGPAFATGTTAFYAATAGITLAGTMLVSALIPPPDLGGSSAAGGVSSRENSETPAYRITGQNNQSKLYGVVPRVYGRIRFFPYLASTPLVENVGKTSKISALYDFGIGHLNVYDLRIGSLDVKTIDPNIVIHENSYCTDLDIVTKSVDYSELSYTLEKGVPVSLLTKDNCSKATVEIYFPGGLARVDNEGRRSNHSVSLRIRYRKQGTSTWTYATVNQVKGANTNEPAWVYTAEYVEVNPGKTCWEEIIAPYKSDVWYAMNIYDGGRKIYTKSNSVNVPITNTKIQVNEKPFLKGVLRKRDDSDPERIVEYYELLVPAPPPDNTITVTEATLVPFTVSTTITFGNANSDVWQIEVTRMTNLNDGENAMSSVTDLAVVTLIKSHMKGKVINLAKKHTMLEFEYTANDRVSGVIDNINGIVYSVLRNIDANGFTGSSIESANNALIAIDLLTGEANRRPLSASQIDFASFNELKNICNASVVTVVNGITYTKKRYEWNGVIENDMTVEQAVNMVLAPCRAILVTMANGKKGVLIDKAKTTYRQLITPANSWGFSGNRTFAPIPDAFRVTFLDEDADWIQSSVMVYNTGKNASNAKIIEDIEAYGITSYPEAWRYGRYMLAQGIMRSEVFTLNMDVENLAVQRGDLVAVQHDVPKLGGMAFRIVNVEANDIVELDRPAEILSGGYTVRLRNGTIRQGKITGQIDATRWRLDDNSGIQIDDLIALGESNPVTRDYLVQAISPGEDLTATLSLVQYVPELYDVDDEDIPDWDPGFGVGIRSTTKVSVSFTSLTRKWIYRNRKPILQVKLEWKVVTGAPAYGGSSIFVKVGQENLLLEDRVERGLKSYVHEIPYDSLAYFTSTLTYRIQPFNHIGTLGALVSSTTTAPPVPAVMSVSTFSIDPYEPIYIDETIEVLHPGYESTPEPATNVHLETGNNSVTLFWDPSISEDVDHYLIRFSPDVENPLWDSAQPLARVSWDQTKSTHPFRFGSYMIAAVNCIGVNSAMAVARTTVTSLPDTHRIENIIDHPLWAGTTSNFTRGYTSSTNVTTVKELDGDIVTVTAPFLTSFLVKRLDGSFVDVGTTPSVPTNFLVSIVPREFLQSGVADPGGMWGDNNPIPSNGVSEPIVLTEPLIAIYNFADKINYDHPYEIVIAAYIKFGAVNPDSPGQPLSAKANYSGPGYTPAYVYNGSNAWDIEMQVRVSDDNVTWSEWSSFLSTKITAKRAEFRMYAKIFVTNVVLVIEEAEVTVDALLSTQKFDDVAIVPTGTVIQFQPDFQFKPSIYATIDNASTGATSWKVSDVDISSGKVYLMNKDGVAISGIADTVVTGYGRRGQRSIV